MLKERAAEAAAVFQRGIDDELMPEDNPQFYFLLADALLMEDQTEQAFSAARKAAELKNESPYFRSRVAWILYHTKRYDEAIESYRELIDKFDPDHTSATTRQVLREARLVLSNIYVIKEDLAEAEEWLEQVLDEFPDDIGASNDLGYLWADQGKHLRRALKMIRRAVDAEPDNAAYRDSLGWVFYRLKRYQKAVVELEKAAAAEDQPDAVILDHLGDAYLQTNQPEKAKQIWRQAADAFRKQEEPEKANAVEQKIQN
jgi:tetratricopeptide (TPR) repeat protein